MIIMDTTFTAIRVPGNMQWKHVKEPLKNTTNGTDSYNKRKSEKRGRSTCNKINRKKNQQKHKANEEKQEKHPEQNDDGEDIELVVEESGLGPCAEDGVILKSLPGTKEGESGWYFDSNGKPSLWEFREIGWERIK